MRILLIGLVLFTIGCQDIRLKTIDKKLILKIGSNIDGMFKLDEEVIDKYNLKKHSYYEITEMREVKIVNKVKQKN